MSVRDKIASMIKERGLNLAQASLAIGKNVAYLQQFITKGSPVRLPARKAVLTLSAQEKHAVLKYIRKSICIFQHQ